jgi:hypothetical protein
MSNWQCVVCGAKLEHSKNLEFKISLSGGEIIVYCIRAICVLSEKLMDSDVYEIPRRRAPHVLIAAPGLRPPNRDAPEIKPFGARRGLSEKKSLSNLKPQINADERRFEMTFRRKYLS